MTISTATSERVVTVIAASIVLGLGVRGLERAAFPLTTGEGSLFVLQAAGLVVAIGGVIALLIHRRRRSAGQAAADPVASTLVTTIVVLAMLAMLAVLPHLMRGGKSTPGAPPPERSTRGGADRAAADPPMPELGARVRANRQERPEAGPGPTAPLVEHVPSNGVGAVKQLLQVGMLILAFVVLAIILWEAIRRALAVRRDPPLAMDVVPEAPHAAKELEAAMQRFVVDLAEERPDPENQITSAYHRLLAALERAGFPRLPQEAPHEHLHRVLVQLGVSPDPMRRLTELYVFAEFGRSQIGAAHREAASDALQVSLEALWKRYPRLRPTVAEGLAGLATP